jgi:hypothetical protein
MNIIGNDGNELSFNILQAKVVSFFAIGIETEASSVV